MQQQEYIKQLVDLMLADPKATAYQKEYAKRELENYLNMVQNDEGSTLSGIVVALETYLKI